MRLIPFFTLTTVLSLALSLASHANQQLDSLKNISAAGAPFLTLKMLDQAQPGVDQDLYEWILWEQERLKILSEWEQWNDILVRVESLPADIPEQFRQQASSYQVQAYIELGQYGSARQLLREQLWHVDAGASSEYEYWRRQIIETYLREDRIDDARVAMLRLQQDFPTSEKDWVLLRARVLLQSQRYEETITLLDKRLDWQSLALKLLAEYRSGMHSDKTLWQLAQKRIGGITDDIDQLAVYWSISVIAAEALGPLNEVLALEGRLGLKVKDSIQIQLADVDADRLWQAYHAYANLVGNRSELLTGDDASWLSLADKVVKQTPVKARSLYALLINQSFDEEIRSAAANGFVNTLDMEDLTQVEIFDQLFNQSERYRDANRIPTSIRFQLVDQALREADIPQATRLMSGLDSIPADTREFDWLLRRARVLLLGDKVEQGNAVLEQLIVGYQEPNPEDTDRILQVLFDLQTLQAHEEAVLHFRRLMNLLLEPKQKREILFWMGDSFKALKQYEKAALLYLQSAMYAGAEAMDPWAQTARFNAAESLQKAGLVDDARRIYERLLAVTEEPVRRSVLRHNIQQLWLTQQSQ